MLTILLLLSNNNSLLTFQRPEDEREKGKKSLKPVVSLKEAMMYTN